MLEIRNLSSGYGDALVLRDFSCRFENGRVTALMGRNGMGKTTLLKTIMGLIKAMYHRDAKYLKISRSKKTCNLG